MALTFSFVKDAETTMGKLRANMYDVTFDASYPAGGEAFSGSDIPGQGIKSIFGVQVVGGNAASAEYLYHWDSTNKKIIVSYPTGGTAPAALGDPTTPALAHDTSDATPVTASAADQPTHAATALVAGRGQEVAAATDLTSLTVRLLVLGY